MPSQTHDTGNRSTAQVLNALVQKGYHVWQPFGDGTVIDLIIEEADGKLLRIQCKTGRVRNGVVQFNSYSVKWDTKQGVGYHGKIDLFAVYCPDTGKVYMVPVDEVGATKVHLRVDPTKNGAVTGVRWAKDFEL